MALLEIGILAWLSFNLIIFGIIYYAYKVGVKWTN